MKPLFSKVRTCTNCGKEKAISEFYTKGKRVDTKCKSCVKTQKKTRRVEKKKALKNRPKTEAETKFRSYVLGVPSKDSADAFAKIFCHYSRRLENDKNA